MLSESEAIREAKTEGKKVHLVSNARGIYVISKKNLRGDSARDDSGHCAVLTEQGASASHMSAVKVLDTIRHCPDALEEQATL